jgi:hypothetical protein
VGTVKRTIAMAAALLTLAGVSAATATGSSASVCQPNGTGCTQAGDYPGLNALISDDYTGFKVVWTESVVQQYSSGVPLYWTAYITYTNIESSTLTLGCPGNWPDAAYVSEHMSGGSGDDGTVSAAGTSCSEDPGLAEPVPPGGTYTLDATFSNVPWPGSAVAITWGSAGTSPYVYPFGSSPPPPPSPSGKACVFNAPTGGVPVITIDGFVMSGHVGWAYLADPATGTWEYGANEGYTHHYGDTSRTWLAQGNWGDVISAFKGALPATGKNKNFYHRANYYTTYRCVSVREYDSAGAISRADSEYGETYLIPGTDCLSQVAFVLNTYGAPISDYAYLANLYYWVPNHFYVSRFMSRFGPERNV